MSPQEYTFLETLRRVPLFNDLSADELRLIGGLVTTRRFVAGALIFSEGEPCRELLIVQEGSVKVMKTAANGRRQLLAIERAGNSLSEGAVFDGGNYPASAEAESATVLLRLDAEEFRNICAQHPQVALKVIKVLAYRLRQIGKLVEDLSFSTVRGRLLAYLVGLTQDGRKTSSGVEFELPENNEELAARLGTVRELVSRNLGRLHGEGLIRMQRRRVTVPDLQALEDEIARSA